MNHLLMVAPARWQVEILCQNNEGEANPFLQQVLDILYKTDDDEFIAPEEPVSVA